MAVNVCRARERSSPCLCLRAPDPHRETQTRKSKSFGFKSPDHPFSLHLLKTSPNLQNFHLIHLIPRFSHPTRPDRAAATAHRGGCPAAARTPPSLSHLQASRPPLPWPKARGSAPRKGTVSLLIRIPTPTAARRELGCEQKRKATPRRWHSHAPSLALGRETIPVPHQR